MTTKTTRRHDGCLVVGITGASGCGKSTLTKRLATELSGAILPEDPKFFKSPASASYQHRDPASETPSHVDWDAYVSCFQSMIETCPPRLLLVEHFLLLQDPRVAQELDVLLFMDCGTMEIGRNRRIGRNLSRTDEEIDHLKEYYDQHVWPSYKRYCEPLARTYCLEHPESSKLLDCQSDSDEVFQDALQYLQTWLGSAQGT